MRTICSIRAFDKGKVTRNRRLPSGLIAMPSIWPTLPAGVAAACEGTKILASLTLYDALGKMSTRCGVVTANAGTANIAGWQANRKQNAGGKVGIPRFFSVGKMLKDYFLAAAMAARIWPM